jgi:iron complex transport system ATP-binding protein
MGGDEEIVDALKLCGVEKFIDRDFSTLSGGEKRMVSIAGGIYQNADYIMMDEPTSFLDLDKISTLIKILNSLKEKRKGVLLVMHDINLANRISDSILLFREGKVVAFGDKEDVLTIHNLEMAYNAKFAKYSSPEGIRFYPVEMEDFTDFPEEAREGPQHS